MDDQVQRVPAAKLKWLTGEAAAWEKDGIVSAEQAQSILQRYREEAETDGSEHGGKLVTVLSVIGALLLGIGVILFFASNWQAMSKWSKLTLVFGSIIIAYAVGYYLAFEKQNYPRVGRAVIFLGTILYGSGIWLIAQIFHISSHYPNGVLFWAVGIIPIAVIAGSLSVLIEISVLLTIWTVMEQAGFENFNWLFLPLAAGIIYLGYNMKSRLAVGLTLPGVVIWFAVGSTISFKPSAFEGFFYTFLLTLIIGLLIYTLSHVQTIYGKLSIMKMPCQIVGLAAFLFSLFILSFKWMAERNLRYYGVYNHSLFFIISFSVIALCTAVVGVIIIIKNKSDKARFKEVVLVLALLAFAVILTLTAPLLTVTGMTIITNLVLFVAVIAVIVLGYINREPVLINFGVVFFVIDVVARYFDFFWDMLNKSVFFMVGGLLLLVGGTLLERNRRKIVQEMKVKNYAT